MAFSVVRTLSLRLMYTHRFLCISNDFTWFDCIFRFRKLNPMFRFVPVCTLLHLMKIIAGSVLYIVFVIACTNEYY